MTDPIEKLARFFAHFPGVGARQSKRFVYYLLREDPARVRELAEAIQAVKDSVSECASCYLYFRSDGFALCEICRSGKTDKTSLMIVEKDADHESIRRSGLYSGAYFVLGGLMPLVEKGAGLVRAGKLLQRIEQGIREDGLKEIVLALSLSTQGEHTDAYLRRTLAPLAERHGLVITSLGKGLSTGTELEYSDNETIKYALQNRG